MNLELHSQMLIHFKFFPRTSPNSVQRDATAPFIILFIQSRQWTEAVGCFTRFIQICVLNPKITESINSQHLQAGCGGGPTGTSSKVDYGVCTTIGLNAHVLVYLSSEKIAQLYLYSDPDCTQVSQVEADKTNGDCVLGQYKLTWRCIGNCDRKFSF